MLRKVSATLAGRIRRLRIGGEALLVIPRITHGVVPTTTPTASSGAAGTAVGRLSQRAVGCVGKVLGALRHGSHVHRPREGSPGGRLGGGAPVRRELGGGALRVWTARLWHA